VARSIYTLPEYSLRKPSGLATVKYQGKVTYRGKWGTPEAWEAYATFTAKLSKPEPEPVFREPAPSQTLLVGELVRSKRAAATYLFRSVRPHDPLDFLQGEVVLLRERFTERLRLAP
jgi:hypothetical protein